jgi:hypothetical protein
MVTAYYEIRVDGMLPPEVLLDFEWLSAHQAPVETVLHGPLPDQAALAAFLARLEEFGVNVIEIRRLRESGSTVRGLAARFRRPVTRPLRSVETCRLAGSSACAAP